ncbi:MAG: hypothetical protein WA996_20275 [Candidatus Promineifilaceae bacterium]
MKTISKWVFAGALLFLTVGCDLNEPQDQESTSLPQKKKTEAPESSPTTEASESDQYDVKQDDFRNANADVLHVRATQAKDGSWTFHVTVLHPDTGWEDYADGWDVVTEKGEILKISSEDTFTRLLLHPHEDEQPFTRNQGGIVVPQDITRLTVRAHDIVDGFGGVEVKVDLSVASGPDFVVERD